MNNCVIIVNKDNLVKCVALLNSLNRTAGGSSQVFTVCLDEISKLLLDKLKLQNTQLLPLRKIEKKFTELYAISQNIAHNDSFDAEYAESLSPFIIKYIFEDNSISELSILPHSAYFFQNPERIFNAAENYPKNCRLLHHSNQISINIKNDEDFDKLFAKSIESKNLTQFISKSIEINIFDDDGSPIIQNFNELEFLTQYIVVPNLNSNKLLNAYELSEIYAPYIDELYIALASLRTHLSDYSEGLFNDLDISDEQNFIAPEMAINQIDVDELNLEISQITEFLYYFSARKDGFQPSDEEQNFDNIHTEDIIEQDNHINEENIIQAKEINMADPINFEVSFDDFSKSDNSDLDQKRINSQIENLNIKLHNENTIREEKARENQNNNYSNNTYSNDNYNDNISNPVGSESQDDESDEAFLINYLQDKNFEILNFDVDNQEELPYYDVQLSIRIHRQDVAPIQNEPQQSQSTVASDFIQSNTEDPRLYQFTPATNPQANIVWEGSQFVYHSLALINRELSTKIIDSDAAELTIVPYENDQFFDIENDKYLTLAQHDIRYKDMNKVSAENKKMPFVWIRHQWPPQDGAPKGAKWIIMQPWEFSALPKRFVELFKQADEIWTPSTFCRKAYIASGLDYNKVQVIPNGISPEDYTPFGDKMPLNTFKSFKFLFVGGTTYRKGIDILLDAYENAFTAEDDVCLIIKDMGGDSFYRGQTAKDKILAIQAKPNAPEILYIDSYLTEQEMYELYRSADVFVSPYRGEGFSLPTLEAMASGLPVIVTQNGATDDFVDENVGWQVNSKTISIGKVMGEYELTHEAEMLEPDKEELATILREVAINPADLFKKGTYAMLRAREQWTWQRSALKMFGRLDNMLNTNMAKQAEDKLPVYSDSSLEFARGMQLFDEGEQSKALGIWERIMNNDDLPERYKLHILHIYAYISINNNDFQKAERYLQQAVEKIIEHPDNNYLRSLMLAKQERYEEVYDTLSALYDRWTYVKYESTIGLTLDDLLCLNGECAYLQDDTDSAMQLYTEALKYNSENPDACYGAGITLKKMGLIEDAKKMLEWAIKINPNHEEAKRELNGL